MLSNRAETVPPATAPPVANAFPHLDRDGAPAEPRPSANNDMHPHQGGASEGSPFASTEQCEPSSSALHNPSPLLTDFAVEPQQYLSDQMPTAAFHTEQREGSRSSSVDSPLADLMHEGPNKVLIDRLISPGDPVLYDKKSGRLRHSCPIIAFHEFSAVNQSSYMPSLQEKDRRVKKVLRDLSADTHDHLMECFWTHYTPVMQVVDRQFFQEDMDAGDTLAYSGFLHVCILAMGYRYADWERSDIQMLALTNKESTLHREAKYMVELELEQPGGIPSVQALLILGQLESGSGRDAVGSMYAGMN
jgi:hypothetical protein